MTSQPVEMVGWASYGLANSCQMVYANMQIKRSIPIAFSSMFSAFTARKGVVGWGLWTMVFPVMNASPLGGIGIMRTGKKRIQ